MSTEFESTDTESSTNKENLGYTASPKRLKQPYCWLPNNTYLQPEVPGSSCLVGV